MRINTAHIIALVSCVSAFALLADRLFGAGALAERVANTQAQVGEMRAAIYALDQNGSRRLMAVETKLDAIGRDVVANAAALHEHVRATVHAVPDGDATP